jgi:DNA-binding XRE family transcriptional regulator
MIDREILKKSVSALRVSMNLSQASFAAKIGKSYATVQNYEQEGKIPPAELWVFVELARERGLNDLAALFKRMILDNLPAGLISIIREPDNERPTEKASEAGSVNKRRIRA